MLCVTLQFNVTPFVTWMLDSTGTVKELDVKFKDFCIALNIIRIC